jgi:ribosome maturation factor RimP
MNISPTQLDQVRKLADEVAQREGCRLYDLEVAGGRTLRVYIEKLTGGASIDDCVNVSRGLNLMLDVEDPIPGGRYELEVSTPGLERKLTQLWHFEKAVGEKVRLAITPSEAIPASLEGTVKSVENEKIIVENNKGSFVVEFPQILKAKQLFEGKKR